MCKDYIACKETENVLNDQLVRIWQMVVMARFKVLPRHTLGRPEPTTETLCQDSQIDRFTTGRFAPDTSGIRVYCFRYSSMLGFITPDAQTIPMFPVTTPTFHPSPPPPPRQDIAHVAYIAEKSKR